jgi:hypothetical protein
VRVSAGDTADPVTVVEQIRIVEEQFGVEERWSGTSAS